MANNKIYQSAGVYTNEIDLSYAAASIGVTTLGVVGETLKGPAFEPILVTNSNVFRTRFGLQSPEKFSNGVPKYELPYIANAYLGQSNQLYVTRILGLSGYDAGKVWAITTIGGIDTTTMNVVTTTGSTTFNSTGNTFSDTTVNSLVSKFDNLPITPLSSGSTFVVSSGSTLAYSSGTFSAKAVRLTVTSMSGTTGNATYELDTITGTPLSDYNNMVVATLRSRGNYVNNILTFNITGVTATNPLAVNGKYNNLTLNTDSNSYMVSMLESDPSFIGKVLGYGANDGKTDIFVEELYSKQYSKLLADGKIFGVSPTLVSQADLNNYKRQFATPETPFVVSELRGNQIMRLFKFVSISDGNAANKEIKINIENINFDTREFDVVIRSFDDLDTAQTNLEAFRRCTMNPSSTSYIAKRIGTTDETYSLSSNYIMVEVDDNAPFDAVPSGFEGYNVKNFTSGKAPMMLYKTTYDFTKDKVKKAYLGISDIVGIDQNMFNYIGENISNTTTKGFHLDINADNTIYSVGNAAFNSEGGVVGTDYENINARKFTFAPAGGFDGWDIYRTSRTNTDIFRQNQSGFAGFSQGLPSDYYAYLKGIMTFSNPNELSINLFATPGIDYDRQNGLVKETIDMVEELRKDTLYIVTTPDQPNDITSPADSVDLLNAADIDSSYTATFSPWVLLNDTQNGANIFLPPTFEFLRDAAQVDKKKAPWFAIGGYNNGQLESTQAKLKLSQDGSDDLYVGRINPIRTFSNSPLLIMGNKTLQVADSALNRINVRRLLLQVRQLVSVVATRLIFEPNDIELQEQFKRLVNPILADVKKQRGLIAYEVICDDSNNSNADRDQLQLNAYIRIKPTNAAEFIVIDFGITDQGAQFSEI